MISEAINQRKHFKRINSPVIDKDVTVAKLECLVVLVGKSIMWNIS